MESRRESGLGASREHFFYLHAASEAEKMDWIAAINQQIDVVKGSNKFHTHTNFSFCNLSLMPFS